MKEFKDTAPAIDTGIAAKDRAKITSGLAKLLADSYTLYLKTHNFHWTVTGPMFNTLHLMFETQYNELALAVDEIAERIRALGFPAPGTYKEFVRLASIKEVDGVPKANDMVRHLVAAQEATARTARKLFPVAGTPQAILDLGLEGLESYIKTIGLYHSKARHLLETCRMLVELHGGQVPRTREALEALPGVGRKTANVVLNVAFGEPTMAVDTHIFRVGNRTGLAPGKTPLDVEKGLLKRIPPAYMVDAHHWLILHGRYVCQARKPLCWQCAAASYCGY